MAPEAPPLAARPADEADAEDRALLQRLRSHPLRRFLGPPRTYLLTRFVLLRLLGFVYFIAFLSLALQLGPLLGHDGLLPADRFLGRLLAMSGGSPLQAFRRLPTLFVWLGASDGALHAAAWTGVALSLAVCAGVTNALVQAALWALYLSFVRIGQVFYGYGWELQLAETGFLAIFLCPLRGFRPFRSPPPPVVVIWLYRWLIFRIMLGAGLIKLRGDPCWRDLTCLVYHYETQPVPSPLSYFIHQLPRQLHMLGVLFNHLVELVVPWFAFGPRPARHVAGVFLVLFQVILILSGNLSFLNWLTIVPAIACFDDGALGRLFPARLRERAAELAAALTPSRAHRGAAVVLAIVVLCLSVGPVSNLLSPRQAMNASFDKLALVNTYGAFGSVGRERYEVILEGTSDEALGEGTRWLEYDLPCKPGDVRRRPCLITPYHYRLDWQIWFAAFGSYESEPWLVHFIYKLLAGDPGAQRLLAKNPFPGAPPRYIRAELYRYSFTRAGDGSGAWWRRERVAEYLPPLSADDPALLHFLDAHGWPHAARAGDRAGAAP
ncbi:membrane protein [Sorangium cellulosum]|uniref:Membrane protein n=1 Tax=Sorangium cellulosum TaxID=56 RepID=A0A2L0EW70_SORCE|nr:lipase maturation factor family protein [Sorangium cellulosum]AUX43505.1 membrane protein [Sorangium cellulosum]